MRSIKICLSVVLVTVLLACSVDRESTADFAAHKPFQLRMLDSSLLSVIVRIDGTGPDYRGEQQADGTWTVGLDVALSAAHTFTASWYATINGNRFLLLEQQGDFFADSQTLSAEASNVSGVSSGDARFDPDCDTLSNLEEVQSGTDPFTVGGCSGNANSNNPDETVSPPEVEMESTEDPTGPADNGSPTPSLLLPDMVDITGGEFAMGSAQSDELHEDDERQHTVRVADFSIGRYEVTFDQYTAFASQPGTLQTVPEDRGWGMGRRPVILVTWQDAVAYTNWLSETTGDTYRLPTEAEWEYAARAGTTTPFWTGSTIRGDQENIDTESASGGGIPIGFSWSRTLEAGSLEANPWGLYDMLGNVLEFTCSLYDANYDNGLETQCSDDISQPHVVRGAAYYNGGSSARVYRRSDLFLTNQISGDLGFRVVRENR